MITISLTPKQSPVDLFGEEIEAIADDIYMKAGDDFKLTRDQFISMFAYNTTYSSVTRMVAMHTVEMRFEGEPSEKKKKVMTIVKDLHKIVTSVMNRNERCTSQ